MHEIEEKKEGKKMNMPQSINLTYICFNGDHTDEEPTVLNL